MKRFEKVWVAVATLTMTASAFAAEGVEILSVDAGGTGCPVGTVDVSEDQEVFLFSAMNASAGPGRSLDRKGCGVTLALAVEPGYRAVIEVARVAGYARAEGSAKAISKAEAFFAGQTNEPAETVIEDRAKAFTTHAVRASSKVYGECGVSHNARLQFSVIAQSTGAGSSAEIDTVRARIKVGSVRCE